MSMSPPTRLEWGKGSFLAAPRRVPTGYCAQQSKLEARADRYTRRIAGGVVELLAEVAVLRRVGCRPELVEEAEATLAQLKATATYQENA